MITRRKNNEDTGNSYNNGSPSKNTKSKKNSNDSGTLFIVFLGVSFVIVLLLRLIFGLGDDLIQTIIMTATFLVAFFVFYRSIEESRKNREFRENELEQRKEENKQRAEELKLYLESQKEHTDKMVLAITRSFREMFDKSDERFNALIQELRADRERLQVVPERNRAAQKFALGANFEKPILPRAKLLRKYRRYRR